MREFSIRLAKPSEIDQCVWFDAQNAHEAVSDEHKRQLIESSVRDGECIVACDPESNLVGYGRIAFLWPMMMPMLAWCYVLPDWRNHGVLAGLLQDGIRHLLTQGYDRLLLSARADRIDLIEICRSLRIPEVGKIAFSDDPMDAEYFFLVKFG